MIPPVTVRIAENAPARDTDSPADPIPVVKPFVTSSDMTPYPAPN